MRVSLTHQTWQENTRWHPIQGTYIMDSDLNLDQSESFSIINEHERQVINADETESVDLFEEAADFEALNWDPNEGFSRPRNSAEELLLVILDLDAENDGFNYRFQNRRRNEFMEIDCPICLEGITEQTSVSMFHCSHLVHLQCMKDYVSNGIQGTCHVCPMCRKEFDSQETLYRINWVDDMDNHRQVPVSTGQEMPIQYNKIQ